MFLVALLLPRPELVFSELVVLDDVQIEAAASFAKAVDIGVAWTPILLLGEGNCTDRGGAVAAGAVACPAPVH